MLTVQPGLSNFSKSSVTFRSKEIDINAIKDRERDAFYQQKVDYYKKQAQEFDDMSKNTDTPKGFRAVMKGFRVISEALLEGWAVAWGASKGSKVLKSSVLKGLQTNFGKHVKNALKSIGRGIKASGKKVSELYKNGIKAIKDSKFAEEVSNFVEKMRNNSFGKYVVKGFEYLGKAFKYIGSLIASGAKKVAEPFTNKTTSEIYDKVAKGTSVTLGVGAGAAGAYSATISEDKKNKIKEQASQDYDNSYVDDEDSDLAAEVRESEDVDLNEELDD